jgi:hypothetical protein
MININSENFDDMVDKLSSTKIIAELIKSKKLDVNELPVSVNSKQNPDTLKRKHLQKEYDNIKKLKAYLPSDTTQIELKELLRDSFFHFYEQKMQEFSFVYKLEYPMGSSFENVYVKLEEKIGLYILKKYGVTNIKYKQILKNMDLANEDIKSYTIGTIESYGIKNIDGKYHHSQDKTIVEGVASFLFYPFVMIKRDSKIIKSFKSNSDIDIQYKEITNTFDLDNVKFKLYEQDKKNIENFIKDYHRDLNSDTSKSLSQISARVSLYKKVAEGLFDKYNDCENIECIDKTIKHKLDSLGSIEKKKEFTYKILLSNDDDIQYTMFHAFRELKKRLKRDTLINSIENTESINGDIYKANAKKNNIVAIVKKVKVLPYIQGDHLGLYFDVKVSYSRNDVCRQYFKGVIYDKFLKVNFVRLKKSDGTVVALSQTEITNRIFRHFLPKSKKLNGCNKTHGLNMPVNCLDYNTIDKFIAKLNRVQHRYKYRLMECKEAMFFATCNHQQPFCWGNSKNYSSFEFIRKSKYDFKLHNVGVKKENDLHLYDFCGNAAEVCVAKRGRYKEFFSDFKSLKPKISRRSYDDVNSFRLIREDK